MHIDRVKLEMHAKKEVISYESKYAWALSENAVTDRDKP